MGTVLGLGPFLKVENGKKTVLFTTRKLNIAKMHRFSNVSPRFHIVFCTICSTAVKNKTGPGAHFQGFWHGRWGFGTFEDQGPHVEYEHVLPNVQ